MDNNETIELPRLKEQIDAFSQGNIINNELPVPIFQEDPTVILPNFSNEVNTKEKETEFISVPMVTSIHPVVRPEDYEDDEDDEIPMASNLAKIIGTVVFLVVVALVFYFVAKKYLVLAVYFNDLIK